MKVLVGADQNGHTPLRAAACGATAAMSHDLCMNPFDTVKQRMQLGHYNNIGHCIRSIYSLEGTFPLCCFNATTRNVLTIVGTSSRRFSILFIFSNYVADEYTIWLYHGVRQ